MYDLQEGLNEFLAERNYISPWINSENDHNDLFAGASSITTVKKKQYLFSQGEYNNNIYIVRTGRFRVHFLDHSGSEKCVYIVEKGGIIGEIATFDTRPSCASAYAITDATVFKINVTDFMRIINLHPMASLEIINSLNYKVRLLYSQMEYSIKSSSVRVAASIIALCARYGVQQSDGSIIISIRFTHEELANLINLNRVTVSKAFHTLQQEEIITNAGGHLVIKDINRLKTFI